jgi:hypothetical protein
MMKKKKCMTRTVYVEPEDQEVWEDIKRSAAAEKRGVGYFVCRMWERTRESKGE